MTKPKTYFTVNIFTEDGKNRLVTMNGGELASLKKLISKFNIGIVSINVVDAH